MEALPIEWMHGPPIVASTHTWRLGSRFAGHRPCRIPDRSSCQTGRALPAWRHALAAPSSQHSQRPWHKRRSHPRFPNVVSILEGPSATGEWLAIPFPARRTWPPPRCRTRSSVAADRVQIVQKFAPAQSHDCSPQRPRPKMRPVETIHRPMVMMSGLSLRNTSSGLPPALRECARYT